MSSKYEILPASKSRKIFSQKVIDYAFNNPTEKVWEELYQAIMDPKYKKNTRNFTTKLTGEPVQGTPSIYLIPRQRGGPSYKNVNLVDENGVSVSPKSIQYCAVSKGYGMQDLSSFTMGPVVGEGLCVVNAAFSKCICIHHIEGGGKFNPKRTTFWERSKKKLRDVVYINEKSIKIDGMVYDIKEWLKANEKVWLPEWLKWSRAVALCSMGDFHWARDTENVGYRHQGQYLDYVPWKIECYIKPALSLMVKTKAYQFLSDLYNVHRISVGLVHPKSACGVNSPITLDYIKNIIDNQHHMACMPYLVAGKLLGLVI